MGLFKDIGDTTRAAKKLSRDTPPVGVRLAEMNQRMAAHTNALTSSTVGLAASSAQTIPTEAQVVSAEPTGHLNGDPIVTVSVLVLMNGAPPIPITQSVVVPAIQQHRLQPGVRLPARVNPHRIEEFALDWTAAV